MVYISGGYYIAPGVCESPPFGGTNGVANGVLNKPVPEQSLDGGGVSPHTQDNGVPVEYTNLRSNNPYVITPPHNNYNDADGPPEV